MNTFTRLLPYLLISVIATTAGAAPQKKPPQLTRTEAFATQYREAVRAVARYVGSPKDFFAEIEPKDGGRELWFHLWHKTAFTPENRYVAGNPGGQCRDVVYDTRKHKVTHTWWWQ